MSRLGEQEKESRGKGDREIEREGEREGGRGRTLKHFKWEQPIPGLGQFPVSSTSFAPTEFARVRRKAMSSVPNTQTFLHICIPCTIQQSYIAKPGGGGTHL